MTGGPGGRLQRLLGALPRARLAVLLAAAVLAAASLHAALGLRFSTDTADMISAEAEFHRHRAAFREAFPQFADSLLLVLDGPVAEEVSATADALAAALEASPRFRRVWAPGSDAFFQRNGLLYLEAERLLRLSERLATAAPVLASLGQDPSLRGLFRMLALGLEHGDNEAVPQELLARIVDEVAAVAEATAAGRPGVLSWRAVLPLGGDGGDASRRVLVAQPRLDFASLSPAAEAIAEARRRAEALGVDGERVRLRLTGEVALEHEELQSARLGGEAAAGLSLAGVLLLLGFGLRSVRLTLATLLTLAFGLVCTAGFAAVAIGELNMISVAFAVLFVGLGVDFSIHLCLRVREEAGAGDGAAEAIRRAARGTGRGLTVAAAGAGIGFFAFLPTGYRGFAELGLISGSGMFIALAATFTVLPALLSLLPAWGEGRLPRRDPWLAVERFSRRRRRWVLAVATLAGLCAAALLPRLEFDFDPLNLKDPESESFATLRALSATPGFEGRAAEVLTAGPAAARQMAAALAALPEVASARWLVDLLPADQQDKLAIVQDMALYLAPALRAAPAPSPTPAERVAAAQRLLVATKQARGGEELRRAAARLSTALAPVADDAAALAELGQRLTLHLPALFDRLARALEADAVTPDDLPAELRRRWLAEDGRHRVQALPAASLDGTDGLRRFVDAVLAVAPSATGPVVVVAEAGEVVVAAFLQATLGAVLALGALLLALYRRPALLLPTLAPLALAALLTLATSALIGPALNFANVIVLPLLFGVGIASSVHLVERRRQLPPGGALMATTTPRAVLFSTLTTLASFGSLAVSAHRGMASMGLLLTVSLVYTLICTLVLLPSLMPAAGNTDG